MNARDLLCVLRTRMADGEGGFDHAFDVRSHRFVSARAISVQAQKLSVGEMALYFGVIVCFTL